MAALACATLALWGRPALAYQSDALSFVDRFEDDSGIDAAETSGFTRQTTSYQATAMNASLVSRCISLIEPQGASFTGWSYADVVTSAFGDVVSASFSIETCDGRAIAAFPSVQAGCNGFDLSGIDPLLHPSLRMRLDVVLRGAPGGSGQIAAAAVDRWGVFGTSSGLRFLGMAPAAQAVDAGSTVTFDLNLTASGAAIPGGRLIFAMADVNGSPAAAGLAEDAEVDYGRGLAAYRPLGFLSASLGPQGERATSTPTVAWTSGQVVWTMGDLPAGFAGGASVTLSVPKGYVDQKTIAARATLLYSNVSCNGVFSSSGAETADTAAAPIVVSSVDGSHLNAGSDLYDVLPGVTDIRILVYYPSTRVDAANPSDREDVSITISPSGTCLPLFRSFTPSDDGSIPFSFELRGAPPAGATISSPLVLHFDRVSYGDAVGHDHAELRFDVPSTCTMGQMMSFMISGTGARPAWSDQTNILFGIGESYCRASEQRVTRASQGFVTDYLPFPAWPEYYMINGSIRAGEWFSSNLIGGLWESRTNTVMLDHSYGLVPVPNGVTFHGLRRILMPSWFSRLYKDCSGGAPQPDSPLFDHASDPPNPSWHPVDLAWTGLPFDRPPDENDPRAVVPPGCRLLAVKDHDDPAWVLPDQGYFAADAVWRMCDGAYGCAELPDGAQLLLFPISVYTRESASNPMGATHICAASPGAPHFKEVRSWPKVQVRAFSNGVPAGEIAHLALIPEDENFASAFVDGRWLMNLYSVRDAIDLLRVTGGVSTAGFSIPARDQNVAGQTCDPTQIVFHGPDPSGCLSASTPDDRACMAWWSVPLGCQPPNGWGLADPASHPNFRDIYRLVLNAPIVRDIAPGRVISFTGEVRTHDLSALGAENAVSTARWARTNYQGSADVTVLGQPSLRGNVYGPQLWPRNSTATDRFEVQNASNVELDSAYAIALLPKAGTNGSQMTPRYGLGYANFPAASVILESSADAACFITPSAAAWTALGLLPSSGRPGYQAQTAGAVDPGAICLRLRFAPGAPFEPDQVLRGGIDLGIPDDPALEGQSFALRAAAGAFASAVSPEVPPVETTNATTLVSSDEMVEPSKQGVPDPTRAGYVRWTLHYHNGSGATAGGVILEDRLPAEAVYRGLAAPLPPGVSCVDPACAATQTAADGSGGRVDFAIASIAPDDGNPGAGPDEGDVLIWTSASSAAAGATQIRNCVTVPAAPHLTGGSACTSVPIGGLSIMLAESPDPMRGGSPPVVTGGDHVHVAITVTNTSSGPEYVRITDPIPPGFALVAGSITVDGATASDAFVQGGLFDYTFPGSVLPGQTVAITFDLVVSPSAPSGVVQNQATALQCSSPTDPAACSLGQPSNRVPLDVETGWAENSAGVSPAAYTIGRNSGGSGGVEVGLGGGLGTSIGPGPNAGRGSAVGGGIGPAGRALGSGEVNPPAPPSGTIVCASCGVDDGSKSGRIRGLAGSCHCSHVKAGRPGLPALSLVLGPAGLMAIGARRILLRRPGVRSTPR